MKPIHYFFVAAAAAMILAGGSSKGPSAEAEPKVWPGDTVTDEMRAYGIEALKEAARIHGSMVGLGSYDATRRDPPPPAISVHPKPQKKD